MNVFPEIVVVKCNWTESLDIEKWCIDNEITAVFKNQWTKLGVGFASFEFNDESQRAFFILRWA